MVHVDCLQWPWSMQGLSPYQRLANQKGQVLCDSPPPAGNAGDLTEQQNGVFLSCPTRSHYCAHLTEVEPESQRTREVGHSACPKHSFPAGVALTLVVSLLPEPRVGTGGIKGGHQGKTWYLFLSSTPKCHSPANRRGSSSEPRQRNRAVPHGSLEGAREGETRKWPLSGDFEVVPTPPQPAPHKHRKCSLQSPATQLEETPGQIADPTCLSKPIPYGWGRRQPLWSHSRRLEPASSAQCPPGASLLASEMESKRLQGGVLPRPTQSLRARVLP